MRVLKAVSLQNFQGGLIQMMNWMGGECQRGNTRLSMGHSKKPTRTGNQARVEPAIEPIKKGGDRHREQTNQKTNLLYMETI